MLKHGALDDLWEQFWEIWQIVMSKGWIVILYKVQAHCGNAELAKGQIKFRDLKGNAYADIWAGKGAETMRCHGRRNQLWA